MGLNPARRGAALARDMATPTVSWCWPIRLPQRPWTFDHIDVDSAQWAAEVAGHSDPRSAYDAEPGDLFMLIFTSGTSGEPKAVRCTQSKVAIAGRHDGAALLRWAPKTSAIVDAAVPFQRGDGRLGGRRSACRGSLVLRRKFSASQFLPDIRRYGATYANYVGKPLSYVLATPQRSDDADNPLRAVYGNEGAPARC